MSHDSLRTQDTFKKEISKAIDYLTHSSKRSPEEYTFPEIFKRLSTIDQILTPLINSHSLSRYRPSKSIHSFRDNDKILIPNIQDLRSHSNELSNEKSFENSHENIYEKSNQMTNQKLYILSTDKSYKYKITTSRDLLQMKTFIKAKYDTIFKGVSKRRSVPQHSRSSMDISTLLSIMDGEPTESKDQNSLKQAKMKVDKIVDKYEKQIHPPVPYQLPSKTPSQTQKARLPTRILLNNILVKPTPDLTTTLKKRNEHYSKILELFNIHQQKQKQQQQQQQQLQHQQQQHAETSQSSALGPKKPIQNIQAFQKIQPSMQNITLQNIHLPNLHRVKNSINGGIPMNVAVSGAPLDALQHKHGLLSGIPNIPPNLTMSSNIPPNLVASLSQGMGPGLPPGLSANLPQGMVPNLSQNLPPNMNSIVTNLSQNSLPQNLVGSFPQNLANLSTNPNRFAFSGSHIASGNFSLRPPPLPTMNHVNTQNINTSQNHKRKAPVQLQPNNPSKKARTIPNQQIPLNGKPNGMMDNAKRFLGNNMTNSPSSLKNLPKEIQQSLHLPGVGFPIQKKE